MPFGVAAPMEHYVTLRCHDRLKAFMALMRYSGSFGAAIHLGG